MRRKIKQPNNQSKVGIFLEVDKSSWSFWYRLLLEETRSYANSGGVMVSKLEEQTYTSEFESHWVSRSLWPSATSKQRT